MYRFSRICSFRAFSGALLLGAFACHPVAAAPKQPPQSMENLIDQTKGGTANSLPDKMDAATVVQKANEYFNSEATMIADFTQVGADGRKAEGVLSIVRPGRMRFEYASPATMEVIADGTSVSVRDKKAGTQDVYFINQTPLKFLLNENIDLNKDVKVIDATYDKKTGGVITIEDSRTFGGTSHIKLLFDPKTFDLKKWQITDPQGYETIVSLSNITFGKQPNPSLFKIDLDAGAKQN